MPETVFIMRRLQCPDSETYDCTGEGTVFGFPRRAAERAARGVAAAKVIRALRRVGDNQECPSPCKKVVSDLFNEDSDVKSHRVWWTFWTCFEATAQYAASITVSCVLEDDCSTCTTE